MTFYENAYQDEPKAINEIGIAHICYEVEDVQLMLDKALAEGGSLLGEKVKVDFTEIGKTLEAVYFKDPQGNIIELSCWK